uniref:Uncharacterized protein n=1 Tax=Arundo donax TaxID=35708 RepID=A0A0A9DWY7_ARUDO
MGMADANKRINLAAPLLSVRRHGGVGAEDRATATALPYCKPDETSGPLGHTGAVPFGWEHRPGHPKSVRTRRPPPPAPMTTTADESSSVAQKPTAVTTTAECAREEEQFSDALSRDDMSCVTVNCSATGLSDAASASACGRAGAVPGARGSVMMDRFLLAAHAVAAGSPQCTFRKAASAREPARPAAASARGGDGDRLPVQRRLPLRHVPTNHLRPLTPEDKNDDDDDADADAESDALSTRDFASKKCGLLPTRCVKSTLLLLNPAPAMRRGARRGARRPFRSDGGRGQRATNPLLRRLRNDQQQSQQTKGHDPGMQSWEELYVKSLFRSGGGGLTGPAAAVASELDRTVRELYRHRGAEAVPPKASHLGLLLVLDRSSEERHGSLARNLVEPGETALLLPSPESSRNAGKKLRRGAADAAGCYGFQLLLEDKEAAAGREIVLSPQPLLPLPLPKSPSESWLSRALPSVSTRPPATSFLGLHVQSRKHAPLPWCSIDPAKVVDHARQRQIRAHDLQK